MSLTPSKPVKKGKKPKKNFYKARIEKIRKNLMNQDIDFPN